VTADRVSKRVVLTSAVPLAADFRDGVIYFVWTGETADNAVRDVVICWVLLSRDGNYVAGVHGSCLSGPVSHAVWVA
jgi:hypothetical protein